MRYVTIKELTDKDNKLYSQKIVSRRTIFRRLDKFRKDKQRFTNFSDLSFVLKNNTMISEDYLYLFYNKKYIKKCKGYTEITINLNDDYKRDYYVHIAKLIYTYFDVNLKYSIENKGKRFHVHILINKSNIDKDLFVDFLNYELQIDKKMLLDNINIAEVRDLDRYYHYITKSADVNEAKRDV